MTSPSGISAIVGVLDDQREQLRNEGLLLLSKIVKGHTEIAKRVAFENAFDKVFSIINEEGGLYGSIVTEDCFSLLVNLLAGNVSNQNWFRETEFFKKLTDLLIEVDKEVPFSPNLIKNVTSLLGLIRLFVQNGSTTNQAALMKSGILTQVISLAYHIKVPQEVRAKAWLSLADLISNNKDAQDYFAKASAITADPLSNGEHDSEDIDPLLTLLLQGGEDSFDMRYAVSSCVLSFAQGNQERKLKILQNMIDAYLASKDHNILDCMLSVDAQEDQLSVWFATCTLLHLTHDDEDARQQLTELMIGDAAAGEEEVSIIQTISGNLITSIQRERSRATAAYLMLLSSWLFDAPRNVADFLEEQSTLQAVIGALQSDANSTIIKGLCAILLSITYAFNFADESSINRRSLQTMLLRVGREVVVGCIVQFSHLDVLREDHISHEKPLLDKTFIEFFRDNYGQIRKAVDQPPVPPTTRKEEQLQEEQARNDDMISELETELERKSKSLDETTNLLKTRHEEMQRLRDEVAYMNRKHESESAQAKKDLEKCMQEVAQLREEGELSSRDLAVAQRENAVLARDYEAARKGTSTLEVELRSAKERIALLESQTEAEASKRSFLEKEMTALQVTSGRAGEQLQAAERELKSLQKEHADLELEARSNAVMLNDIKEDLVKSKSTQKKAEADAVSARTKAHDMETDLKGLRQEVEALQRDLLKQGKAFDEEKAALLATRSDSATADLKKQLDSQTTLMKEMKAAHEAEIMKLRKAEQDAIAESAPVAKLDGEMPIHDAAKNSAANTNGTTLQDEVAKLTAEKEELQKQLEQAQEDLLLLMEDAGDE